MAKAPKPSPATPKSEPAAPVAAPEPEKLRVRQAFTLERVEGGWSFVTLSYTKDAAGRDHLVEVKRTEPNLKVITLEAFKIAAFNYWTKGAA